MGDKKSKSDIDMLSELSCMPSITSRERKSTLNESGSGGNGGFTSKFKSEKEMNDYIQKCINDALNQKPKPNGAVKTTSTVKEEYSNPRKESATGKHAGVNSFIRNLGTIGYGEERKDMVNNKSFANGGGHAKGKSEEKIADNILQKLKEREEKDKKAKERGEPVEKKKPKYKSTKKKEKEAEEPVEIAPEDKKIYSFTKVHSVFNSEMPMSQQIMNQQQQMRGQMRGQMPGQMRNQMHGQMRNQMPGQMNNQMHGQMRNQMHGQMRNQMPGQMNNQMRNQMNNQMQGNTQQRPFMGMTGNTPSARGNQIQHPIRNQAPNQIVGNQIQNSFVFIMPSYNGVKWIKRIFDSIRSQTYTNYRIIYVDDCSTDNTVKEINSYKRANPQMNIEVITNQTRQWPAYSRFVACRQVYDHEVCVFLDGDDWLVDNDCLSTLNTVFQNPNIYATFGSMSNAPWQYKKWKKYNRANINDGEGAYFPHLRTTRAAIVKAIPPYYMQTDNHEWLHVCTDVALFMAVIEAVGQDGYVFLKNEFVHYNTANHSKNTKEGYNNSKGSDMRLYYRSTIRDKIPMKKIVRSGVAGTPQQNMLNYAHNQQHRTVSQSRRYR
jgi:glycosyltransferase involved in cell wall biosynthesis